jgi:hypothetical protein
MPRMSVAGNILGPKTGLTSVSPIDLDRFRFIYQIDQQESGTVSTLEMVSDSFVVRDRQLEMIELSPAPWDEEKDLLGPSSTILFFRYNLYLLLYTNF